MEIITARQEQFINGELFHRYSGNPIVTADDWPYPVNSVFNPGAVKLPSGETVLLARVESRRGVSFLNVIRSDDGLTGWHIDPNPALVPEPDIFPEEMWGIEDPRIIYVPELEQYAITYTAFSTSGPLVSMAMTKDFVTFEKIGNITLPHDKDACIFPRRIGGNWLLVHRPETAHAIDIYAGSHIWLSYSNNLKTWTSTTPLIKARMGSWWDANKIGLSTPPIETKEGWLLFYHGVRNTAAGCIYRIGVALLDLENPKRIISRSKEWIFGPKASYELVGDVNNVVFPCGYTLNEKTGELRLYYGAADTSIAVAIGNISQILDWLVKYGERPVRRMTDNIKADAPE
ncbi:glycosidase [Pelotomaculum terephthalicicum JT]|uniref:glycoside hydrolase family 130 protein n=1 Tax=Pelotomaculum TaxID=191373 RepID=UPI0009C82103|nr:MULTISPECIES: glycosidase [Pelotomaculum]MCG9968846.1 glycosidase [Pelotomaculum terephthalicicum JT]OPX85093.1 MAG: Beta-1,4-mannooligosaccharide phosphorylase [Pelotomaculum sp. PtaB.Bin117]OPY59496.1 MAG: Beta-1,4-mannooligosaccharide phosphorylase [Pelotomaculum sp. PtaU1.Bin035]